MACERRPARAVPVALSQGRQERAARRLQIQCFQGFRGWILAGRHARTKQEQSEPASVSQPALIASAGAMPSSASALSDLRQAVARIEGAATDLHTGDARALPFGIASLDHALAGGLAPASLHEITPNGMPDRGSAIGFTLALAARAHQPGKALFWITTDFAALEAGETYGLGCDLAGSPRAISWW